MRKNKKPQFMTERRNAGGEIRYYWQPSRAVRTFGFKIESLGTDYAEAVKQANRLNEAVEEWKVGRNQPEFTKRSAPMVAGSFLALVREYKQTAYWRDRRPNTLRGYENQLKKICAVFGQTPVALIRRADISAYYNAQAVKHRASANAALRVIKILMNYAVSRDYIVKNPTAGVRMVGTPPRRSVWSVEAERAFLATCDKMNRPSVKRAFLLSLYAGQRQGDVLSLRWDDIVKTPDGPTICLTQSKTGAYLEIPVCDAIAADLKSDAGTVSRIGERTGTLCKNEYTGKQWTADAFHHCFADIRDRAQRDFPDIDFSNLQYIDLRRTCVVRMAEKGATIPQITAVTGHKIDECAKIVETYLPRNRAMATAAIRKLNAFC